ncbi:WYL domain-containing protein [Tabrizicola sp. J26]|uniref:helix-turn-helix transcriptional regulator n=1 Tax=Alitabrizicola rongguiensis TaxID=2909234 RepID=UPI001F2F836B|nr:WYL domain-containing protein [Tabrizicola rongguiensis]MCF1708953.1 WYL domain-containing protein [Tabrizicola rongguiensis]
MPRPDTLGRLDRLDLLASRLKADEPMTVAELAAEFAVSERTLARDLEVLRARGLPVEADRGRGGGVRLHRLWGVGRLTLTAPEAINLLVSLAIAEKMRAPWLLANLDPIRRKLAASFSPALRDQIGGLRRRLLIGTSASAQVVGGFTPPEQTEVAALFSAFLEQRELAFRYAGAVGEERARHVEPQLLLLNYPVWYLLAWDIDSEAVRTFRCDRIRNARSMPNRFTLRPPAIFAEAMAGVEALNP